ncbi:hypothetical protein IA539_23170 [Gordonia sp. zg691]|uniref:hypothetical protein n=1 Tax=Gordonia jinghuaiqii TaxID=2758710 RepID=UPI0016627C0A|nr:hypothetical protein [Gordonia jinghuaiqii]MBD0864069.1 hypothetical protein [Gordonia jinghuaiqii]
MTHEEPEPTRATWLPRRALLFFALVAVLVLVFVWLRPNWFIPASGGDGPTATAGTDFVQTLSTAGSGDDVVLSDDNTTSSSFTFTRPQDARVTDTRLILSGRSQAEVSRPVFLKVFIDGAMRHVERLGDGKRELDIEVAIPQRAVEDNAIDVQVRLSGASGDEQCVSDRELGALVVLDARGTRVTGDLDSPLESVRDVVTGLGQRVTLRIVPPEGDSSGELARGWIETATRVGVALTREGYEVRVVDASGDVRDGNSTILIGPVTALAGLGWEPTDGATGSILTGRLGDRSVLAVVGTSGDVTVPFRAGGADVIADAAFSTPRTQETEPRHGSVMSLAELGLDTSAVQVTRSRAWRVAYSLADLPGGRAPQSARLGFQVPPAPPGSRWLTQIQLNGQLVASRVLTAPGTTDWVDAPLPAAATQVRNQLTITVSRDRDISGCQVREAPYSVALSPDSALVGRAEGAGFTALPAAFAWGFETALPAVAARNPAQTVSALVPALAEFSGLYGSLEFVWERTPDGRPFVLLGSMPIAGIAAPVALSGDRLEAAGVDVTSMSNGLVLQTAATQSGATGLLITPVGDPADVLLPPLGREAALIVPTGGRALVVDEAGRVVPHPPERTPPP